MILSRSFFCSARWLQDRIIGMMQIAINTIAPQKNLLTSASQKVGQFFEAVDAYAAVEAVGAKEGIGR
jgi:hypothetical protein